MNDYVIVGRCGKCGANKLMNCYYNLLPQYRVPFCEKGCDDEARG